MRFLITTTCLLLGWAGLAVAQDPPPAPPAAGPQAAGSEPAGEASPDAADAAPEASAPAATEAGASADAPGSTGAETPAAGPPPPPSEPSPRVQALLERVATLEEKAEEAEMAALLADDGGDELEEEPKLRFYGFADFGAQRAWSNPDSPITNFIETNALSFVTGNLNLYIDAKPADAWRTLIEVRFTNAPHGLADGADVYIGGNQVQQGFSRVDTYQIDPHGSGLNVPMWRGSIVLERAWTEWQAHQLFKLRVGHFFTPWGIWNIDHGSPTLISISLPQFILQNMIPIRQTGLQVYGSSFFGDWQLGYHATLTNGRVDESLYDFDDDKALGARLYLKRELGTFNMAFGASGYMGSQSDEVVNLYADDGLVFDQTSTWRYDEKLVGADLSIDFENLRIRSEYVVRMLRYAEGKRLEGNPLTSPQGAVEPDVNSHFAYLLAAYRLPFWGLEPLLMLDGDYISSGVFGDVILTTAPGLNIHFEPGTLLKLSYAVGQFFQWRNKDLLADSGRETIHTLMARVVTAF